MMTSRQSIHQLYILIVWSILSTLSSTVQGEDTGWKGCVDPENPTKLVRRGQKTTICMGVGPPIWGSEDSAYARYSFKPVTDDYSRFTIPSYCARNSLG